MSIDPAALTIVVTARLTLFKAAFASEFSVSDTGDLPNEDDVLRRMLNTPHEKHKPLGKARKVTRPPEPKSS
jgi:hypothetical protein